MGADPICPIADVTATVLSSPVDVGDLDSSADTLLIEITDEEGRVGIGEADTASLAGQTLVHMTDVHRWNAGLRGALIGADPFRIGALWRTMAERTTWPGPSGIARQTIAGIDMALHDLVGRQLDRPVHDLLGGAVRDHVRPYATIYAGAVNGRSLTELMEVTLGQMAEAVRLGFRAIKMEVLFDEAATDRQLVECLSEGRALIGDDITMLVDFGYRWSSWRDALYVLRRTEDCDLWLAEAPLQHDDLDGHAKLAARIQPRLGGAEMATTLEECRAWIEHGEVDVLQLDVARAGGLTGVRRVVDLAALHGVEVVPHNWKTGINAAAARHLQAASANVPLIEMLTPHLHVSPLRQDLVHPEPVVEDGVLPLPAGPGLGIELDRETVARYAFVAGSVS